MNLIKLLCALWSPVEDYWCGCDGEGMAHRPGSEGFPCAVKMLAGDE